MKNKKNKNTAKGLNKAIAGTTKEVAEQLYVEMQTGNLKTDLVLQVVLAISTDAAGKPDGDKKVPKLTVKQKAAIRTKTEKAFAALAVVPPPPTEVIIPAPALGSKNPLELYSYCEDKFPRIDAVSTFDTASPSVAYCTAIADLLFPLAGINSRKISEADLKNRRTYTKQLRDGFNAMALSCALLANGNASLFALTEIATRRKGNRNHTRLAAPEMVLNVKKGEGVVGVKCKPIKFAKSYTIYFGTGADITTYQSQTGSSSQLVEDLDPGRQISFYMTANTGKLKGFPCAAQAVYVPYN